MQNTFFKRLWTLAILCGVLVIGTGTTLAQSDESEGLIVNLDHLKFLTEPVTVDDQEMALVHIYSEFPNYKWVDAANEGISAVDDVARAAVVYLWEYERTGDESLLDLARLCLNFVMYMQADDGEFYNFVYDRTGEKNLQGITSYKSLGWWAVRGLWSLGEGVRVFQDVDAAYADLLADAYLKTEQALGATMGNYGEYTNVHGFDVPAWIPANESTIASVGMLGLAAYYQARPNETTADILTKISEGVAEYRLGTHSEYPFGLHPTRANAPGFWHNWGAQMPHALAVAGMTLGREDWIESAAATADSFLLRHIVFEPFRNIGVIPDRMEQIAYGTNMLVLAYTSLYEATGEARYARYAGLAGSWYFGNNMAGAQMYFPETGRVYDGINGPVSWRVNRNSGAESTIEALMSLSALARLPETHEYLYAQAVGGNQHRILQAENGDRVVGTPIYFSGDWTGEGYISAGRYIGLGEGQRMRLQFEFAPEDADDYLLYVAHVRQSTQNSNFVVQRADQAPVIDGDASDWADDVPVLEANAAGQILRGGGLWRGAEVDSHAVRLMWDDENLYGLVTVRDPEHVQEFTLSSAGSGDAVWLYFTEAADARSLSGKFTLAETPDGAQIWDWTRTRFANGGVLAWSANAEGDGYTYEFSLPFATIDIDEPAAGLRFGFEAGRSFGGNSFMDLTGRDPDVASNLLQLTLIEPGMDASDMSNAEVALEVRINRETPIILDEMVDTDADYFWLDLLTDAPVQLGEGEHTIRYEYAGSEGDSNPGLSKIDAFYLQPATARRVFELADGRQYTLTYDTLTGETTWTQNEP